MSARLVATSDMSVDAPSSGFAGPARRVQTDVDARPLPLEDDEERSEQPERDLREEGEAERVEREGGRCPCTLEVERETDQEDRNQTGEESADVRDPGRGAQPVARVVGAGMV